MSVLLIGILLGVYITGAVVTFCVVLFLCCLSGKNSALWKPFVYSCLWFVFAPLLLLDVIRL